MPKINLELKDVGCRKPGCQRRMEPTSRHHRQNESLFINAFGDRHAKMRTKTYKALVQRYASFDERDIIRICNWHHCEIHLMYDEAINEDRQLHLKPMLEYTWQEANSLMRALRKLCYKWEKEETPGRDPADCTFAKRFPLLVAPRQVQKRGRRNRKAKK
ncbi:hypothetical protein LCGC14_0251950 [marine sediment metagenome]|uniref:Uncharacterized protein n=1 Tax=marine sediment metagenome TaxID=412755 RepID=A0A0F9X926_9ZZZZ